MSLPLASTEFLRTLVPFGSKLPDSEEDRGVVAHFLGIPVGFQFGTAAGLTGIPALVTDILTDPTTYLLGGLGGLTKLGRGAVAGAKVLKGFQVAEEAAGVTEKLVPLVRRGIEAGGKTWQETRNLLREPMKLAFQTETQGFRNVHSVVNGLDTNLARKALNEIRSGTTLAGEIRPGADEIRRMVAALEISGPEGLSAHLTGSIGKREQMRTLLDQVLSAPDFATAKGLLKELRGIAPTEAYKNLFSPGMSRYWKQAFEAEKAGIPIGAFAEGARAQVQAGQRALLNLKVPFGPEAALLKGEGIVGGVAEAFGKAGKKLGVIRPGVRYETSFATIAERELERARNGTGTRIDLNKFTSIGQDGYARVVDVKKLGELLKTGQIDAGSANGSLIQHLISYPDSKLHPVSIHILPEHTESVLRYHGATAIKEGSEEANISIVGSFNDNTPITERLFSRILAHELVHNTVTSKLRYGAAPEALTSRANHLYEYFVNAVKGTPLENSYATKNVEEFFSEALSSGAVRRFLSEKRYIAPSRALEPRGLSLLHEFRDIVFKILGVKTGSSAGTALHEAINISDEAFHIRRRASPSSLFSALGESAGPLAAAAAASKPLERLRLTPTALHDTMLAGADEIAKSTAEVLNSGNLSLQGEELLKNRAVLRAQHTRVAEQAGAATEGVFQDTMKEMGLNTPQDYEKVNELLQNPAKILKRPSVQRGNVKITQRLAEGAFGRTDIFGELPAGYTEGHVMVAQAIRSGMQRYAQIATKSGVLGSVIKDYAARVHTILKPEEFRKAMGALSTETTTFWKHAQERLLQGWDEVLALEKRGVLTTEKNPGKLLAGYITSLGKVTADAGLMDGLALDRIPLEVTKKTGKTKDYLLHMMLPGDARFDRYANFTGKYVRVTNADSPSIMTLAQQMGERTGLKGFGYTRHIWVHEDIAKNLRAVIEPGFANPSHLPATATGADKALSTALQINSVAKRALLAPGTVHLVNLTMKSLITNGWDGFVSTMGKTLPDFIKTPNSRSYLENIPDLLDAARHDLVLSAPSDAERDTFQKALRWVSDKLPVSKPVVDAVRNMEGWASGKLWNQYHSPLKLYTYNEILSRTAAKFPELDPAALKRTIAAHVNKSFGGGNLEAFVGSKKGQQLLRLMFISPDWLIGNTKIATDVLAGISLKPGQILPAGAVLANDARAFFARQYALRAGLMMVFAGNFANLAFTGHFMHDNEDASKIQLPGSDSNGRPIYLGMFDPFLFPFELASKPFEFLRRKFGPVPRAVIGEALGRDFYGAPIVTAKDGPLSNLMKRIGFAAEQAAPISLQTTLGLQQGNIPAGVRALGLLGLPIRGSPHSAEQINETVPAAHPTKTKQELRAEVQAEMQAQIEKTVARFGEAHSLMMKSDGYRRGLDRQRDGLAVVPTDAMLAVAR